MPLFGNRLDYREGRQDLRRLGGYGLDLLVQLGITIS